MEFEYRLVTEEDASAYLDFFRSIAGESDNLACSEKEAEAMSIEDERSFIRNSTAQLQDGFQLLPFWMAESAVPATYGYQDGNVSVTAAKWE